MAIETNFTVGQRINGIPKSGLHLGGREGAFAPLKTGWPPGLCCVYCYLYYS